MASYEPYRGRRRGHRVFAGVVIVLILIAAAILVLAATHRLDFLAEGGTSPSPAIDGEPSPGSGSVEPTVEPTFIVETPSLEPSEEPSASPDVRPGFMRAVRLDPRDDVAFFGAVQLAQDGLINTVVLEMGNRRGGLNYESGVPLAGEAGAVPSARGEAAFDVSRLDELHAAGARLVAEISSLKESYLGNLNTSYAVKWADGRRWLDGELLGWLDPYNAASRGYIEDLTAELIGLGFDEVLLTNFSFPSSGLTNFTYFAGESVDGIARGDILASFASELRDSAAAAGGSVSFEASAAQYPYEGNDEAYSAAEAAGTALPALPDGTAVYLTDVPEGVTIPGAVTVTALASAYASPEAADEVRAAVAAADGTSGFLLVSADGRYPASF